MPGNADSEHRDSVKPEEIARFNALAAQWWDAKGPMRPLHMMNPVRVGWITERLAKKFGSIRGVRLLDIGCGAGLLSEALARAGCEVLGLDAAPEVIAAATAHAAGSATGSATGSAAGSAAGKNLPLHYRATTAEVLSGEGLKFQAVTALEVIEHVADPAGFLATLAGLLEPGGILFISTLNRTAKSWLTAKLGAEYLLRLLPAGTHDWNRFVTPAELGALCRGADLRLAELAGMSFDPLAGKFRISRDTATNYIAAVEA